MKQLTKGLTNDNFIAKDCFIKILKPAAILYVDTANLSFVLQQLQSLQLPPNILAPLKIEVNNNTIESHWPLLDGQELDKNKITLCFSDVVQIINAFHNLPLESATFDVDALCRTWLKNITHPLYDFAQDLNTIAKLWAPFTLERFVFSHNDLIIDNFLVTPDGLTIFDYDFAMKNHYLFDYASFISEALEDDAALKTQFIATLLVEELITQNDCTKLETLIQIQNFLWAVWANMMYDATGNKMFFDIFTLKIANYKKTSCLL